MKTLPVNQLRSTLVKPLKKVAPLVAAAMLTTGALVASSKSENTTGTKAVPAELALVTLIPTASLRRKDGEIKFTPELYDEKFLALAKKDSINERTKKLALAICENDKIDVETAKNLIHVINPSEESIEKQLMVINSNHIKNENLPNLTNVISLDVGISKELIERFLNDSEINNEINNRSDLRIMLANEKKYDTLKELFKMLKANNIDINGSSLAGIQAHASLSKYMELPETDLEYKPILPEMEKAGLIDKLEDRELESKKLKFIKTCLNNLEFKNYGEKRFFAWEAHRYIESKDHLNFLTAIVKNINRFENDYPDIFAMLSEEHNPKESLKYFNDLIKKVDGRLLDQNGRDYYWNIVEAR